MALCSLALHILILEKSIKSSCGKSVQTLRQTFEGGCIVSAGGNMGFSLKTEKRVWHIKVKGHCIQGLDMLNNLPPSPHHTHTHTHTPITEATVGPGQLIKKVLFVFPLVITAQLVLCIWRAKQRHWQTSFNSVLFYNWTKKKCLFFLRLLMFWVIIRRLFKTNHMTPCCHI